MIIIILCAFITASRLQVVEHAHFYTKGGEVLEGRVSRDFMTGDYKVEASNGTQTYVPYEQFAAMAYEGSAVPLSAGLIGFTLIIVGAFVGFGIDKLLVNLYANKKFRVTPPQAGTRS
ncbi:hypothetical protein [Aquabacterium sp. NJ1]|uniref:hypothetical protein n=1 Tax=Aquabacterium sp. NJ1 TaxID=1538295 RepID=UPI00126A31B6|nr:hypothetical protein [Aquabacterium sp. NJ1]